MYTASLLNRHIIKYWQNDWFNFFQQSAFFYEEAEILYYYFHENCINFSLAEAGKYFEKILRIIAFIIVKQFISSKRDNID